MRVTSRLPGQQSTGSRNCQIRSQHNGRDPAEVLTNHVFSLCECERFGSASTCAQGDAVGNGRGGCFANMWTNPCARNLSTANVSAELKCKGTAKRSWKPRPVLLYSPETGPYPSEALRMWHSKCFSIC